MMIVNLTPHSIYEVESEQDFIPSGQVARVETKYNRVAVSGGIPLYEVEYGDLTGIPESPNSSELYIVSGMVLEAIKTKMPKLKHQFVAPGELVRDESGKPVGCKGFKVA